MNWVLSVLAGIAVAVLILYFIKKNRGPVAVTETYVQQPVRKGADISEQDSMLVAVGLQALYTPRPSVMDASQISKDAWLASQSAATGGAQSPAAALVQQAAVAEQQVPMGAGSGMAGSPMSFQMTGQAGQAGGQPAQMQVFLSGGPSAAEQLQTPTPTSSGAAAPRARTQTEIDAANAQAQEDAINQAAEYAALRGESAAAQSGRDKIAALKADAVRVYKDEWLPKRPSASRTDTAANRSTYVASLQAKLQLDTLNFNNYFDSNYKTLYGASSVGTSAYQTKKAAAQQVLFDAQDTINALDAAWQSSNAVDCYPVPWPAFESQTQCSTSCGPGRIVQTRKYVAPTNGGQSCPPPSARETREIDCPNPRACAYTMQPAQPVCAYGSTFNTTSKKCVETSQLSPANGCTTGFTYNTSTGFCTKTGTTPVRPTPPPGFTFNTTTLKFEKTSDATFTCATAGYTVSRGFLGISDPFCEAYV
jgi:hypothetical protein